MDNYKNHFKKMKQKGNQKKVSIGYRSNKVRPARKGNYLLGTVCLVTFGLLLYGFLYPEKLLQVMNKVQIGLLAPSEAAEKAKPEEKPAEKSAETKGAEGEKPAPGAPAEPNAKKDEKAAAVEQKPNYAQQLVDKEKELEEREKRLVELEEKLQQEKLELEKKIQSLEQTRRDIASKLESRVAQDEENINKLVGVYSNMKAQNAAQIISKLDEDLAINVLKRMKKQDAGNILNYMEVEKAKVLSEKYSGY